MYTLRRIESGTGCEYKLLWHYLLFFVHVYYTI